MFNDQLSVDVVEVTGSLKRRVAETEQRLVRLLIPTFLHQPSRRFGAEVDADNERDCWDEGGAELQTPGDGADIVDCEVGAESKEDAECGPWMLLERLKGRQEVYIHICQDMTKPPRMRAGTFSAA